MTLPAISPPTTPLVSTPKSGLGLSASAPLLRDGPQRKKGSAAHRREQRAQFLERQTGNKVIQARRDMAKLHKELMKDSRAADDVEFWGAKGKEGFARYLTKTYGSLLAGWRVVDTDGNGKLSFSELCAACRRMGYHGNFKKLWIDLDADASGFISLAEIDPEVHRYVSTYKMALKEKYGDMLTAWKQGIDTNKTGRIEEREIVESLKELGLDKELDAKKLFKMFITGPKGLGLSLAEFDPVAWTCYCSGDHKGLTLKANKASREAFLKDDGAEEERPQEVRDNEQHRRQSGLLEFRKALNEEGRKEQKAAQAKVNVSRVGISDVEGFKKALVLRCGSLMQAWKKSLDIDGNGKITFGEFCIALQRLGLFGDIKGLWKQLTASEEGKGFFLFSALDPETDKQLNDLRARIREKYDNMLLCWVRALDTKGSGLCHEMTFVRMCSEVGFEGDAKALFRTLQPSRDRAFLTLKDFDSRAWSAMTRGDFRMIAEPENPIRGKKPLEMGFEERQQLSFYHQIRRALDASKRDEFSKSLSHADNDKHMVDSSEKFEELCVRKYGSMTAAWRLCLDLDANGRLTFNEFVQALRRLGYAGDYKALWKHYDMDLSGHISMQELAKAEHDRIEGFLKLLREKYGDLDAAWRFGFNKDPHDSIDIAELREACDALGYQDDVGELFKTLQPMVGRTQLTIWDMDPGCTRKRARGQVAVFTEPKSAGPKLGAKPAFGTTGEQQERQQDADARSVASGKTGASPGDVGRSPIQQMRHTLRRAYGSTAAAWRMELDPQMQGSVSRGKFLIVMENLHVSGNMKRLWEDLAMDTNGFLRAGATYRDIDPDGARVLDYFREKLLATYGGLLQAWDRCLDADALGRVDEAEFLNAIETLWESGGVAKADAMTKWGRKLFRLLCARPGQRSLTCEDLQALLIGVPASDAHAVWMGPEPVWPPEPGHVPATSSSDPGETGGLDHASPMAASGLSSFPSSPMARSGPMSPLEANRRFQEQDLIIRSVEGFKKMLVVKYGSLYSAWRRLLDGDGNGILTQTDFAKACQFLGVKDIQRLWSDLDVNGLRQITLRDVDPEVAELFAELERMLIDKYAGDTKEAWKRTFDPDNKLRCDLKDWKSGCVKLGFSGPGPDGAERLFKLLRPEPGRPYLMYEDLWVDKDPNNFKYPNLKSPKAGAGR